MEEKKEWYVVNTISGHEYKVKEKLNMRIETMELQDKIFRVVVPEHVETELKNGVSKEKVAKMFPGYILIEMIMTDEVWYIVRNTQGVTGFIGSSGKGAKPFPLYPHEVDHILGSMGMNRVEIDTDVNPGDKVKLISGAFADMYGTIHQVNIEEQKLVVLIDLFGQETEVDVNLNEIEKL